DPKEKKSNSASCSTSFTVKQPQPPVVSCTANPASVEIGQPITVTLQSSSPDSSRIEKREFATSAGTVSEGETVAGNQPGQFTTTAMLTTNAVPPGPVNVTAGVTDVHGLKASCVASANVTAPPAPVTVVSEILVDECEFKNDKKRARIDNECKAVLD